MTEDLLDPETAAAYLGGTKPYSRQTLANWRISGQGPAFIKQPNRMVRYRRSDLDAWLARSSRAHSTSELVA